MTVYRKCRPCKHRDKCEIKDALAKAIKGFGVGTITHACKSFEADLKRGDNVWVRAYDMANIAEYCDVPRPTLAEFPAHFVEYSSKTQGRAIIYIAPGAQSRFGDYTFEPANGKHGFCKVSYAPYRASFVSGLDKGIIERREGTTLLKECYCGLPLTAACNECNSNAESFTELDKFAEAAA